MPTKTKCHIFCLLGLIARLISLWKRPIQYQMQYIIIIIIIAV